MIKKITNQLTIGKHFPGHSRELIDIVSFI